MRAARTLKSRITFCAGFACLLSLAGAPSAYALHRVGWVFADQPDATAAYTPKAQYSFNSAKGSVTVTPGGGVTGGTYVVTFTKLYQNAPQYVPDNVQISVADGTSAHCTAGGWGQEDPSDTTANVTVQCYDKLGNPTNAAFTLLYQIRSAPFGSAANGLAFLVQGSAGSVAETTDPYNSTGGNNMVTKSNQVGIGAGNYTVTLPGMTRIGGDVQVTSLYGATEAGPAHCGLVRWTAAASRGTTITVQCYRDKNGSPNYSGFVLAYAIGEPFGTLLPGDGTLGGAWLFANDLRSTSPYTPLPSHQYNGFRTGPLTAQKIGTGTYAVTIPGALTYSTSTALVTAVGAGNGYCNLAGWGHATVNVVCYNRAGALADSRFNVTLQTAR